MQHNYFYTNPNSISKELCQKIINMFELDHNKYEGVTFGGLDKEIKYTTDLIIPNSPKNPDWIKWSRIRQFLESELSKNVKNYVKISDEFINKNHKKENTERDYYTFGENQKLTADNFMIQRYTKQTGRYIYHDDFHADNENKRYRVLTYLWYLNTVEEGGETEFWGTHTIKPETGKLLLFPASWTFPHRGKIPISDNKYIITGWLYYSHPLF